MKIRKFMIGWLIVIVAALFTIDSTSANQIIADRIDNDVGIEQISIDNTFVAIDFENIMINLQNEAEIEISPGDNFSYVSSTSNDYDRKETLLGSLYMINNTKDSKSAKFDNSNNTWTDNYSINYEISTENNKNHFRLDRSRCLIYTGNIA